MYFKEQLGYADMATLNCIHEGCDTTVVSTVWFIVTPIGKSKTETTVNGQHFQPETGDTMICGQTVFLTSNLCQPLN